MRTTHTDGTVPGGVEPLAPPANARRMKAKRAWTRNMVCLIKERRNSTIDDESVATHPNQGEKKALTTIRERKDERRKEKKN